MKKRILVGKIIGFLGICIFAMGITYIVTYYFEKAKYADINLVATFEDNDEFTLENVEKLSKEEALQTYPYIFTLENKSNAETQFKLKIQDEETGVNRENLDYIVFLNDKEISSGTLSDLKEDTILNASIAKKSKDIYKIYIYFNKAVENAKYTYSLKIITG